MSFMAALLLAAAVCGGVAVFFVGMGVIVAFASWVEDHSIFLDEVFIIAPLGLVWMVACLTLEIWMVATIL